MAANKVKYDTQISGGWSGEMLLSKICMEKPWEKILFYQGSATMCSYTFNLGHKQVLKILCFNIGCVEGVLNLCHPHI